MTEKQNITLKIGSHPIPEQMIFGAYDTTPISSQGTWQVHVRNHDTFGELLSKIEEEIAETDDLVPFEVNRRNHLGSVEIDEGRRENESVIILEIK